jgi:hypothetical protein
MSKLKTLWGKVHAFLRNARPYDSWFDGSTPHTRKWEPDLFDEERDPWYTTVYWYVRRAAIYVKDAPRDSYYALKYAHQRLTRGWDDRAVWSIDWWLDDKMPDMLRKLKKDKHGIPGDMFEGLPTVPGEEWNHTEEAYEMAEARWNGIIDKMIAAFEANRRMQNLTYEDELGEYPLHRPTGVSRDAWAKVQHDRFEASQLLRERDEVIFQEGMALFVKHYRSLWD